MSELTGITEQVLRNELPLKFLANERNVADRNFNESSKTRFDKSAFCIRKACVKNENGK